VIGVNLDSDPQNALRVIGEQSLPWRHALVGDWSSTDIPRKFGLSSVPSYVLIDPEGRIVAREALFDEMAKKIDEVLRKR
jgi:hypothetical protein